MFLVVFLVLFLVIVEVFYSTTKVTQITKIVKSEKNCNHVAQYVDS